MGFEIIAQRDEVVDRVLVSAHEDEASPLTLGAGEGIRVQIGTLENPVTILAQQVPEGKQWTNIHFQFQAQEDPV